MQKIRSGARRFFTGLRLFLPLVPRFVWIAFQRMRKSTIDYWQSSQSVVDVIADDYMHEATEEKPTEYDTYVYWVCYSIASFVYLLGWLSMSWLTVEAFRLLTSWIF